MRKSAATNRSTGKTVPKLLTGGNPQISKGDGNGPVQDYIAAMPGWKRAVGATLDRLIGEHVPAVQKAVRWNTPFYGLQGRGQFMAFDCTTVYVKVAFFQGASLDPMPPETSKQASVRYFHIRENEPLDEEALARWIQQAAALPGEQVFPWTVSP